MLATLSKAFGMSRRPPQALGAIRQVSLGNNIFQFAMPENFSRDMPADDMVEQLYIRNLEALDDPENRNFIRRWWDIKESGIFGKQLGTVMMNLSVRKAAHNTRHLLHRRPLIFETA